MGILNKKMIRTPLKLFIIVAGLVFIPTACSIKGTDTGTVPTSPPIKGFTYTFPLKVGNAWNYRHFVVSVPHDSMVIPQNYTADTIHWAVKESTVIDNRLCYRITSVKNSLSDSSFAFYRQVPDTGLICWAIDTSFSGQELLKATTQQGLRKNNQLVVPAFVEKDTLWDFTDGKGQQVTKRAVLKSRTDTIVEVTTFIEGKYSCRELFNPQGLVERVFANEIFYDDIRKDSVINIDSLILITN